MKISKKIKNDQKLIKMSQSTIGIGPGGFSYVWDTEIWKSKNEKSLNFHVTAGSIWVAQVKYEKLQEFWH